jgi:hypothetical protein
MRLETGRGGRREDGRLEEGWRKRRTSVRSTVRSMVEEERAFAFRSSLNGDCVDFFDVQCWVGVIVGMEMAENASYSGYVRWKV